MTWIRRIMMAGRITLLILMTGLFAGAWSSDHAPGTAGTVTARVRRAPAVRETALRRWDHGSTPQIATSQPSVKPAAVHVASSPVPRTIPAGTYLVVNPDGRTDRVVIAESQTGHDRSNSNPDAADHFVSEWNGQRQHWIRMSDSSSRNLGHENVVVVLLDRNEILENQTVQPINRQIPSSIDASLQRLLSPLVEALTTLRNESMAAEDADSVKR